MQVFCSWFVVPGGSRSWWFLAVPGGSLFVVVFLAIQMSSMIANYSLVCFGGVPGRSCSWLFAAIQMSSTIANYSLVCSWLFVVVFLAVPGCSQLCSHADVINDSQL